jgi:oxalate---CoA ligase
MECCCNSSNPVRSTFLFSLFTLRLFPCLTFLTGCSVSRLSTFVKEFYSSQATYPQNVDEAFCAFVWSLIVQQPNIRVGLVPEGVTSEVWIAPQVSAKRKANERGETHVQTQPPELEIVPDATIRPMGDLQAEYGEKLRIACDPESTYAAITGSHLRVRVFSLSFNSKLICS